MQSKLTVHLRRKADGEVIGDILNEKGELLMSKSFGMMGEDEYANAMQQIKQEFPDAAIWLLVDVDTCCDDIGF